MDNNDSNRIINNKKTSQVLVAVGEIKDTKTLYRIKEDIQYQLKYSNVQVSQETERFLHSVQACITKALRG